MVPDRDFGHLEFGANMATLALAVVSTLTYYVCWRWSEIARVRRMAKAGRKGSSTLPSPVPLLPRWIPFIGGHSLQLETEKLNDQVEGWADEFGGDYELFVFGRRVVFVTGTEDARRILHLRPTKFARGWFPDQFRRLAKRVGLNPTIFFEESKEWGRSRRLISPALNGHNNVADMVPAITRIAERVCAKLDDETQEAVDVVHTFERYTHDVIALAAFGFDADSVRATRERPCVSFDAMSKVVAAAIALFTDPLMMLGWTIFPTLLPLARATKLASGQLHQVVQVSKHIPSARRCPRYCDAAYRVWEQKRAWPKHFASGTLRGDVRKVGRSQVCGRFAHFFSRNPVVFVQGTARSAILHALAVPKGAIDAIRHQTKEGGGAAPSNGEGGALLRKLVSVQTDSSSNVIEGLDNRMTFTDKEIVTQVTGLFLAGSETTARTLSWTLYFLAKHPEMVSRCREEALRVAPLSEGMVSTIEQAAQLPFCSAVFKETLRLHPPGPVLFLHSKEPFVMKSGLEFKAQTAFAPLLRYPCLSEDAFTRAKDFVPERWIDAERQEALLGKGPDASRDKSVVHREEVAHFFGSGPRKCPGMADPPSEVMKFTTGVTSLRLVVTRRLA